MLALGRDPLLLGWALATLKTSMSIDIARGPEQVFDFIIHLDSPAKTFRGYGPIPAVERTEVVGGGPLVEGAVCRIISNDGSAAERLITVVDRPTRHAYKLQGSFRAPISYLVKSGVGEWRFAPIAGGTRVVWEYAFDLTGLWAWPMAYLLMTLTVRRAMRDCLALTKQCLEQPEEPLPQPAVQP